MLTVMKRDKLSILVCFLVCSTASCIVLITYYHCFCNIGSTDGKKNEKATSEKHVSEETIKIDYDELCPDNKFFFADKISRGIANTINKGAADYCKKYRINDELEKKLIWSNTYFGQLLDSLDKDRKSIVSICLIKPHQDTTNQRLTISNYFQSQWGVNLTMEYKCLEGNVHIPIAVIKTFQTINGKMNSDGMILYYSEDSGWKILN